MLAGDAAGILERDYGIDAGEVLSMNVDTVETQTNASEVSAADADQILGKNGKHATWGSYLYLPTTTNSLDERLVPPTGPQAAISDNWEIVPKMAKRYKTKTSLDKDGNTVTEYVKDSEGNPIVEEYEESTVMLNKASGNYEFLRNDSEWQNSSQNNDEGKFIEATYKTTIGGDTRLQGSPSWDACGELTWFFKLSEDGHEGYGITVDNHGYGGCGIFGRNWNSMYVFHYDADHPFDASSMTGEPGSGYSRPVGVPSSLNDANIRFLKEWRLSPLQTSPRYNVTVHEKDGKCTVTVDPDELNSPNSYIGGELLTHNTIFSGYEKGYGYESAGDYTDEEREAHANHSIYGFKEKGNGTATLSLPVNGDVNNLLESNYNLRTALATFFDHQENFDWKWKGATQDEVTFEFDLSDSIQKKRTTQAFNAYSWNGTYFSNNSVDVVMQKAKSFGDIVYEPSWTDGALHMLINIDTKADKTAPFRPFLAAGPPSSLREGNSVGPSRDLGRNGAVSRARDRPSPARPRQAATLARDAAGILERDYGIDAGEVLSMNVDTVETVTGGIESSSPDFAQVVNDPENWEAYAQKTYRACFADQDGYILSKIVGTDPSKQGYYDDVTTLPSEGQGTPQPYYLVKMVRGGGGDFASYSVKATVPAGTTTEALLDANGAWRLNGSIYSSVTGGNRLGIRDDYAGWYGTALLNNNEYDADNIDASFHLVQGGNLNEGFAFMVNKSNVTDEVLVNGKWEKVHRLTGYFMSVSCHNNGAVRTLWRVDNYALDSGFSQKRRIIGCGTNYDGHQDVWYAGHQISNTMPIEALVAGETSIKFDSVNPMTATALATWVDDGQNIDYNVKADGKSIKIVRKDNGAEVDASSPAAINNANSKYGYTTADRMQTSKDANGAIVFPNERDVEKTVANIEIVESADGAKTTYKNADTGKTIYTVNAPNLTKGTYGFWGDNCEQGNQALITGLNVAIEKTIVKSFGDIVYEPTWTDGALHMLINIDTKADKTMLGNDGGIWHLYRHITRW